MQDYLKIINLCKDWGELFVRFSCTLEKGKLLGIVGHSGSGKSTVLRLIAGLLKPTAPCQQKKLQNNYNRVTNSIMVNGKDISHLPPSKRGVGMVFQDHALFSHMRVDDNVAYGLRSCKAEDRVSKKESRFMACELLEKFGLSGFARRYPDSLSGGEAQRVSLARTLIVKPDVVLFDEPFSSLDAPLRKKLAVDIRRLQTEQNFTGIMVTHDIAEAKQMSDVITVMQKGSQVWTGVSDQFSETMI
ncbi:MAG: ABC transporter ATP-binding protein [Treponema sp. CETP13]|nr:MAG: ABC transporter ATP-binding protein [Treponema sp. CETP13]